MNRGRVLAKKKPRVLDGACRGLERLLAVFVPVCIKTRKTVAAGGTTIKKIAVVGDSGIDDSGPED